MCVAAAIAGAGVVGSVASSVISGDAAQSAADTQAGAANNATEAQLQMFNTAQKNLQPFMSSGTNALNNLSGILGKGQYPGFSFQYNPANDPQYNFLLQQGSNAITSQASALGGLNSGATLKALSDYGQNTALQSYQTEFANSLNSYNTNRDTFNQFLDRLYNVSSLGENAAAGAGNAAIQTGQSIGSNMIGAGNARAAGTVGSANALSGGISSLLTNPAFLNAFNGSGGGAATGSFSGGDFSGAFTSDPYYSGGGNQYGFAA